MLRGILGLDDWICSKYALGYCVSMVIKTVKRTCAVVRKSMNGWKLPVIRLGGIFEVGFYLIANGDDSV